MQLNTSRQSLKVELLITRVLVKNEQILIVVQSAHDKTLVELPNHSQLLKIALTEHLAELPVLYVDVTFRRHVFDPS
jgi:hypothetical protein